MSTQLTIPGAKDNSIRHQLMTALKDTKISEARLSDLAEIVSSSIEQGIFYLGLNKNETDRGLLKVAVIEDCRNQFPSLTLSEIAIAIKRGVRGEFGEVYGIAPKDVLAWLSAFKKDAIRLEALKEIAANDEINRTPTEQEEIEIAMNALDIAWRTYKETGTYVDHGNTIYNILDNNRKFSFTREEKNAFLASAKFRMLNYYAPEKHIGNDVKMKEIMAIYTQIRDDDSNVRVRSEAKRIALMVFFERLLQSGKDIWDLFKY